MLALLFTWKLQSFRYIVSNLQQEKFSVCFRILAYSSNSSLLKYRDAEIIIGPV